MTVVVVVVVVVVVMAAVVVVVVVVAVVAVVVAMVAVVSKRRSARAVLGGASAVGIGTGKEVASRPPAGDARGKHWKCMYGEGTYVPPPAFHVSACRAINVVPLVTPGMHGTLS